MSTGWRVPDPPQDPKAESSSPGCVTVSWKAPAAGADSYTVLALPTNTLHTAKVSPLTICGLEAGARYSFEIRSVGADGQSEPARAGPTPVEWETPSKAWGLTSWTAVVVVLAAGVVTLLLNWSAHTRHGVAFACGVVGLGLLVLTLVGGRYGLWRGVIGADRRVSTSYLTTGLWTVLVAFALAYMTGRAWFHHETGLFDGFVPGSSPGSPKTTQVWDDYLILLGGPFAALVFARGVVSSKVQDQTVQKTLADDGTATLKQALTDDSGKVDLVDSQYLLFNVVALAYVIVGLASTTRLPSIPAVLLALTGSSAATYVLNKAVDNQRPTVAGVVPSSFRPGERVVITGVNLMPAGADRPPLVTIGGKQAIVEAQGTDAQITAVVPPGVPTGTQELVVTTAARASTQARPVEVLTDQPQILSVDPPTPTIGQRMAVRGVGFTSALDPTTTCSVVIEGSVPQTAVPTKLSSGLEEITLTTPADAPTSAPANVVVRTPR
jgi:hypothetical protein